MKKKTAEQKLKKILAQRNMSRCLHCSYYKDNYCNDLDERVDPNYPICSEQNYNS